MIESSVRGDSRRRVYYVAVALALVAALVGLALALTTPGPVRAQGPGARGAEGRGAPPDVIDLSVDPAMVKGAASAPVTIVEFSDYQ